MDIFQECALNFQKIAQTTKYIFHVAKNKRIEVFLIDFKESDFHHVAGLQYLTDIQIPRSKNRVIPWILEGNNNVTEEYLQKSAFYKGKPNDEKDVEKRISELRFLEEYLDNDNIVYIYSPKDSPQNNSLINCDYIIKSKSNKRNETVFIFLKHRSGSDSACRIISFGVKKKVEYGGIYTYVMLKDKIINGDRKNLFRHKKYGTDQIILNEPGVIAEYITDEENDDNEES